MLTHTPSLDPLISLPRNVANSNPPCNDSMGHRVGFFNFVTFLPKKLWTAVEWRLRGSARSRIIIKGAWRVVGQSYWLGGADNGG